ncbi:MAG: TonB-dependent receptor [Ignavibacteriaceae bacterium]
MKQIYRTLLLFLIAFTYSVFAQTYTISGVVTNAESGEKLVGANVYIKVLSTGAVTNADGVYEIPNIPKGTYELTVSYVGFITESQNVYVNSNVTINFNLQPSAVLLGETVVKGTRATLRETPVAFTEVEGADLEFKLASRDLPQMLNTVPSVYSSPGGGGAGDADLYVRGFNQRDIAIMINGVPVNDMENGWVYWSNWAGLGDVTANIQVQRGLGASPYSVNSIGGIVNVQTFGAGRRQEFAKIKTEFGSDNLRKTSVAFATNLSSNFGLTVLVSRKTWDGYAIMTPLDEFTYFFSFGGVFGNHSLEFTGIGSPQEHGQRLYQQSINTWHTRGFDYNPNWGYLNGQPVWERYNKYHKPQFNLNWNWQISDKSLLSTVGYFSFGNGFGTGRLGSNPGTTTAGLIDWDAAYATNTSNIDTNYSSTLNRSVTAIRESWNNHFWTGLLSTFKYDINSELVLNVGIDGRYYVGEHYRRISNLLGGDYYVDNSDVNNPNRMVGVGDRVAYFNDGLVRQFGGFTQIEYNNGKISTFLNVSASQTGYQRKDYFNFLESDNTEADGTPKRITDWEDIFGYTAKTGANFNFDQHNNIFFNVGYFSRAPIFDNVFDFANNKYQNIENEKILGVEAGYGLSTPTVAFVLNGFYTSWKDRAISRSVTNNVTGETFFYNIVGAEQRHIGAEFEGRWMPKRNLEFAGSFSWAENKFMDDVSAIIAPEDDPNQQTFINSYVKDLYVGDFPMTRAALQMMYTIETGGGTSLFFNPVYTFYGRQYAQFDPDRRTDETDRMQSWRVPDFYLIDIHAGVDILFTDFFFKKLNIALHVFNALNNLEYIVDAVDGSDHNKETANVFYGRDRWWNISFSADL